MILPKPEDAIHKAWMYRLLSAIADDPVLVELLRFKGGTCAAMRGILPRFSVDLDFDLMDPAKVATVKKHLESIFKTLDLKIADRSQRTPQYFLKYPNEPRKRALLKLDITFPPPENNEYEAVRFIDIDRVLYTQTIPTMFANKLVAVMDRYKKGQSLAGRDLYDLDIFLLKGHSFRPEIIEEQTGKKAPVFLKELKRFIQKHFTQTIIDEDLNTLLPPDDFKRIRKVLRQEVISLL